MRKTPYAIAAALTAFAVLHSSGAVRVQKGNPRPGRIYTTVQRLSPERLSAVNSDRRKLQASRRPVRLRTGLRDFKAIMHAHADDSAHTGGSRPEMLGAARNSGVEIILLTDHARPPRDFIDDSWRGLREGVLFIPGSESEGFLVYPRKSIIKEYLPKSWKGPEEYLRMLRRTGGNIFLSHVEERDNWSTEGLDGLEIYNNHTDFMDEGEFLFWLRGALSDPGRLAMLEKMLAEFGMEVFGSSQDYLPQIIAKWDRDSIGHRLTGVAANDCHHNQVYTVKAAAADAIEIGIIGDPPLKITTRQSPKIAEMLTGKNPGDLIARIDLDPYERSMSYVSTHILSKELNEEAVRDSLKNSRAYVSHDWLCDPSGFAFIAEKNGKRAAVMGDEISFSQGLKLRVEASNTATIKLFRNGQPISESKSSELNFDLKEPGIYRVELWLEIDGEMRPWIYSNQIRVK